MIVIGAFIKPGEQGFFIVQELMECYSLDNGFSMMQTPHPEASYAELKRWLSEELYNSDGYRK